MQLAYGYSQDPKCHSSTTYRRAPSSHFETLRKLFVGFFYLFLVFLHRYHSKQASVTLQWFSAEYCGITVSSMRVYDSYSL
jgi:hypothetical protein